MWWSMRELTARQVALLLMSTTLQFGVVRSACSASFFACQSGECVRWRFYCDGICECNDCSDEDAARCHASSPPGDNNGGSMSSGALIAIVVVCVVVLLLVISGLIIFIVCRRRSLAMKPTHTEREVIDEVEAMRQSGQGLPIDIPVEALHREPPPRYDETSTGRRRGAGSRQNASTASDTSAANISTISALPPPPPYEERDTTGRASSSLSAPVIVAMSPYCVGDADSGSVFRFDVPPPMYRSRPDLSGSTADLPSSPRAAMRAGSSSTGRLRSLDSFMEFPSMSDILLTSSRSSLPEARRPAPVGRTAHAATV